MNEEIVAKLGMDTGPFAAGIRSAKSGLNEFKESAKGIGEAIKGFLSGGGGAVAALATIALLTIEGAKKVMEYAKHLTETAERADITTTALQQVSYEVAHTGGTAEDAEKSLEKFAIKIGEARSGSEEAVKAFQKWGISIYDSNGAAIETQDVLESVAAKMKSIDDPTMRNAMAFELFGKAGIKLVATLQDLEKAKADSKGKIISDDDLAILDNAKRKTEGLLGFLKVWGAKAASVGLVTFGIADPNAGLEAFSKKSLETKSGAPPVKETKEFIEALKKLKDAREAARVEGNNFLKESSLLEKQRDLTKEIAAIQGDSVEKLNKQIELEKTNGELKKMHNEEDKKDREAKEKAEKEAIERAEKERELAVKISEAKKESDDANSKLANKKNEGNQFSIQELANFRGNLYGDLYGDRKTAREIQRNEKFAQFDRAHFNVDALKGDNERIAALRKTLSGNVLEAERNPFKDLEDAAQKSATHLQEILDTAKGKGLNVVPVQGK